jgi:hypothetical protein
MTDDLLDTLQRQVLQLQREVTDLKQQVEHERHMRGFLEERFTFGECGMSLRSLLLPSPRGRVVARVLPTTAGTRADSSPLPAHSSGGGTDAPRDHPRDR